MKLEIKGAQETYKKYADRDRIEAPLFEVGDKVWLDARNIKTQRPSKKLDYKKLGPFTITEKINHVAFRLSLPKGSSLHDVFHVKLLERYHENEIENRIQEPPPPDAIDGFLEYKVEEILDSK